MASKSEAKVKLARVDEKSTPAIVTFKDLA